MNAHQAQLAQAWPTFVDAMWDNLPDGTDSHVGMTTTSFYDGSCSEFVWNCETTASHSDIEAHDTPPTEGQTGINTEAKAGCGDECVVITGLADTCIEDANNSLWQLFGQFSRYQPIGSIDQPTAYADVVGTALAGVFGETCDDIHPER